MEIHRPSHEQKYLNPEKFEDLAYVIDELIDHESEPLVGNEEQEIGHVTVGGRREIPVSGGRVIVARYDEAERDFMAGEIAQATGLELRRPIGHVEARIVSGSSSFDCGLYLTDDKTVKGLANCRFKDPDEVLLDESRACYDFASSIGLQDLWVDHMFSGDLTSEYGVSLDDRQASDLTDLLGKHTSGTSG